MNRYLQANAKTIGAALALLFSTASAAQSAPAASGGVPFSEDDSILEIRSALEQIQAVKMADAEALVSRYGNIIDAKPVGVGGFTAWTVEKNGKTAVLYTTADATALFTGIIWDAKTGKNISDGFLPPVNSMPKSAEQQLQEARNRLMAQSVQQQPVAQVQVSAAAMDGKYTGDLPESMITVDSLAGIKEGNGAIGDTVYIIVDPRCQYCRKAYNETRDYVRKGFSIKWIPTAALGDYTNGIPLAATLLQSEDKDVLTRILSKHERIKTEPTEQTLIDLERNLEFMFAAFKQNGGNAGVPVAFFLDHRTGQPRMLTGVSEQPILDDIFGRR